MLSLWTVRDQGCENTPKPMGETRLGVTIPSTTGPEVSEVNKGYHNTTTICDMSGHYEPEPTPQTVAARLSDVFRRFRRFGLG